MSVITINGKEIQFSGEPTILEVATKNNIDISTLCFLEECSDIGTCGVCVVEVKGRDQLFKACVTKAIDGMIIETRTPKVEEEIKARLSEILDKHSFKCGPCKRRENCELLKLVIKHRARASKPFIVKEPQKYIDDRSKSIVIDRSKCVKCGRCVETCKNKTSTKNISFQTKDNEYVIGPEGFQCFDDTKCLLCGQCVVACPVDALYEKSHLERVKEALEDSRKHVIVAMAPSIRTSMGEMFKMGYGVDVTGKLYTALRLLGFDKVFDINFGADLTVVEEATEFVDRIKNDGKFPMFTSCCSSWVRLVENYYPELIDNLSTTKSPQQIFGTVSKTYYPKVEGLDPNDVFTVTIMPCTAKKYEADREEMKNYGIRNIDAVLTTRELGKMIKDSKIDFKSLEDSKADEAMGLYTGAGAIFGVTGGVMEATLRTAKDLLEGKNLEDIEYKDVRGFKGIKEAKIEMAGEEYNVAVINGAANLFKFINSGKIKEKQYHFIEVMACPGGCIDGGGQPYATSMDRYNFSIKDLRSAVLYNQDKDLPKRKAHKNAAVIKIYKNYMGEPGKGLAHDILHFKYSK